jgi:hypothetical protein
MRWIDSPVFWLSAYLILSCLSLERTVLWMFFSPDLPIAEMYDVFIWIAAQVPVFSFGVWLGIVRNEYPSTIEKLLVSAMVVSFICTITMSYALAYRYVGLIDGDKVTHEPITCLYFSIVTWTTLGYGDVRPSPDARLLAASEAVVGYIWMGAYIGMLSALFRRIFGRGSRGPLGPQRLSSSPPVHSSGP